MITERNVRTDRSNNKITSENIQKVNYIAQHKILHNI